MANATCSQETTKEPTNQIMGALHGVIADHSQNNPSSKAIPTFVFQAPANRSYASITEISP